MFCSKKYVPSAVSQEFAHWAAQGGPISAKLCGLYNSRTLPAAHLQHVRDLSCTQHETLLTEEQIQAAPHANARLVLRASCQHDRCYRVVSCQHLRRCLTRATDCLLCPAHQRCKTYSKWVTYMYEILAREQVPSPIIYDWVDVPNSDHAHFDMVIFKHGRAYRLEIDGPCHVPRLPSDIEKDRLIDEHVPQEQHAQCVSLARFDFRDYGQHPHGELWTASLRNLLNTPEQHLNCVFYTAHYAHLQQHNPAHAAGEGVQQYRFL